MLFAKSGVIIFKQSSGACGSSSVVECHLAKVDVASSNLVYRSTSNQYHHDTGSFFIHMMKMLKIEYRFLNLIELLLDFVDSYKLEQYV